MIISTTLAMTLWVMLLVKAALIRLFRKTPRIQNFEKDVFLVSMSEFNILTFRKRFEPINNLICKTEVMYVYIIKKKKLIS